MALTLLNEAPFSAELNPDIVVTYDKENKYFVVVSTEANSFYRVPIEKLYSSQLRFINLIIDEILDGSENGHYDVLLAPSAEIQISLIREHNCFES